MVKATCDGVPGQSTSSLRYLSTCYVTKVPISTNFFASQQGTLSVRARYRNGSLLRVRHGSSGSVRGAVSVLKRTALLGIGVRIRTDVASHLVIAKH